jgi:anaerobic selenocysteine-containing dehydrogenase
VRQGQGRAGDHRPSRPLAPSAAAHRPKGASDPGWERISWDEALDTVAERLGALAREHGPESVVFSCASPSTSAMVDAVDWVQRLARAFGSPNLCVSMELCGWGRYLASLYTFGASVPGLYMPDLDRAGCILFWGYNPSVSRLAHATATTAALRRGARLIVVDPRRAGLAAKADPWLRVRPGTDAALALAIMHVMLARGWYDEPFVRRWTNAPLLVRSDTGRLLSADALAPDGDPGHHVAWDEAAGRPVVVDPAARGTDVADHGRLALTGRVEVDALEGPVVCRPAFDLLAEQCAALPPALAEEITGVPAADIERTAQVLWESRPVAFYTWSGLEQHSGTTQIIRAINVLYALTGCLDVPGGNVLFTPVPTNPIAGMELLDPAQRDKAIGVGDRPLGPARFEFVTGEDFYTAALDGRPYRPRGLVSFGANLMMAHGDSARGRDALQALDFQVHLDLFMNPTAEQADIVLPVTGAFEAEGLKVGFEVSQEAQSLVQLRAPLVAPVGEARSDLQVIFDLATRLGLGEHFFDGDVVAGWRYQLEPSGVSVEQLRDDPRGCRCPSRPATASTPRSATTACPPGSTRPPAASSCTRRPSWRSASRRCRRSPSRRPAPARARISPRSSRWCSRVRSRCTSARPSTVRSPACAAAPRIPRSSSTPTPPPSAASPRATGSRSPRPRDASVPAPRSTARWPPRWCAASTAGSRRARSSICPAIRLSARTAPTSTWC